MSKRGKGYGRKSKTEEERRAIGGAINSQIQKRDGQGIDIQKREGGEFLCNCLLQPGTEKGGTVDMQQPPVSLLFFSTLGKIKKEGLTSFGTASNRTDCDRKKNPSSPQILSKWK